MDPPEPMPAVTRGGLLHSMPADLVDTLLAVAGPDVEVPLAMVELRLMGGALGRPARGPERGGGSRRRLLADRGRTRPPPLLGTAHAVTARCGRRAGALVDGHVPGQLRRPRRRTRARPGPRTCSSGCAGEGDGGPAATSSVAGSPPPRLRRRVRDEPAGRGRRAGPGPPGRQRRVPRPHRRHALLQPGDGRARGRARGSRATSTTARTTRSWCVEGTLTRDRRRRRAGWCRPGRAPSCWCPSGTCHAIVNDGPTDVRFLNVHAPGGFDRRIGLADDRR